MVTLIRNGNNQRMCLSLITILILAVERVTVSDVNDEEPMPSVLYGPSDHITILNNDNFDRKVYNRVSSFITKLHELKYWSETNIPNVTEVRRNSKTLLCIVFENHRCNRIINSVSGCTSCIPHYIVIILFIITSSCVIGLLFIFYYLIF